jgi:16S rRNA (guanine527-N7)-methyltransferase
MALMQRWNAKINLTNIVRPDEVVAKHFLDSLAIVPHLGGVATLVDVGSGAGFPGAVVALVRPEIRVTLVESVQKKAAFLGALRRELGLAFDVAAVRMEQVAPGGFDAAVSRATFAPAEWMVHGAPLVKRGGLLIAMLGRDRAAPPRTVGFSPARIVPYRLPGGEERALALVRRQGAG